MFTDAIQQLVWLVSGLAVYIVFASCSMPWRFRVVTIMDIVAHVMALILFLQVSFFAKSGDDEKSLMSLILVVMTLVFYVIGLFVALVQLRKPDSGSADQVQDKAKALFETCRELGKLELEVVGFMKSLPLYDVALASNALDNFHHTLDKHRVAHSECDSERNFNQICPEPASP
eukprot:TRINITY_DN68107_c0_g1_i1.p1 TRINITY_DN68107_c0_g1~~TRINITY_DN68107_c0_g1_i1.p1  ORF type:complete len:174 (+),score=13.86 TRINITY_DN68107_c0_g1_i1:2-523(+)